MVYYSVGCHSRKSAHSVVYGLNVHLLVPGAIIRIMGRSVAMSLLVSSKIYMQVLVNVNSFAGCKIWFSNVS